MQLNQQANGNGLRLTDAASGWAGVLRSRPEKRCPRAIPDLVGARLHRNLQAAATAGATGASGADASGCGGRCRRRRPGSVVAQADPPTPMPVIESSAAQRCGTITGIPTRDGVIEALYSLQNRGFDDKDGALTPITAIHRVRPQYKTLAMDIMGPIAAGKDCRRSS